MMISASTLGRLLGPLTLRDYQTAAPAGPGASRSGIYAPGIGREEIEELVPYLSAIYGSLLGAGAKLPADALELQVEWLCRTTTLALAAVHRIAESRAAHLDSIIPSIAATTRGIPNEPQCLSGAACTGGANLLFGNSNEIAEFISEVYAELNDIAIDLMAPGSGRRSVSCDSPDHTRAARHGSRNFPECALRRPISTAWPSASAGPLRSSIGHC
jgi:hypothetical protein